MTGVNIFVVASDWDGQGVTQFGDKLHAEEFCARFLRDKANYGGKVKVFEGRQMQVQVIKVVEAIELI